MAKPNTPKIENKPNLGSKKKAIVIVAVIAVIALLLIFMLPSLLKAGISTGAITGETFVDMPKTNITENPDLLPPTGGELGGDII